ncbi:S26 family signal peptidase [Streptomyces sp. URMC 124]|uniref:S26 family signal peptidase n=1 Tax=Streptomyces sp. URMC 124 TaxID=3423405 RepID=UPI003F197D21
MTPGTALRRRLRGAAAVAAGAALGSALGMAVCLTRGLVVVTVRGTSMAPAFRDGDRVLVRRGPRPAVGRVVVAERPASGGAWPGPPVGPGPGTAGVHGRDWLIKRVAALPGDLVPFDCVPALATAPGERVPPGKVVLLGDNGRVSLDSREVGYFPLERVLGTVLRRR